MGRAIAGAALLAVLVSGCATRGSVREVQADLTAVRSELQALRRLHQDTAREVAQTAAELRAIEDRLRELSAGTTAAGAEVSRLRTQLAAAEDAIRKLQAELAARPTPAPPPAPEPAPREPAVRAPAADALFQTALATFRAREHGQAVLEFLEFLARYPKHPLAASAQYWIGEAYFLQRDYRQALVEYQKVFEHPGADGVAPDALLRIGLCYERLREPGRAAETWERLVREHPSSEAAAEARRLLKTRRAAARP